jgi:hypothetical protein
MMTVSAWPNSRPSGYRLRPNSQHARTPLPASQEINISTVLAGQRLGIKEVDDGIWPDLGYFDLEQKTLQPLDNPFGSLLSPMS